MNILEKFGIAAFATMATASLVHAQPYAWEVGASYITADTDVNDIDVNDDNFAFDATYYFTTVDAGQRSLREAPFLERASFLSLGVDIEEFDNDLDDAVDLDTYSVNGGFIHRESGWFAKAGFISADASATLTSPSASLVGFTPEYDGYSLRVGKYVFENTTLEVGYTELDYEGDFFIQNQGDSESDTIGIGLKHYGAITEAVAFSFEANYYFLDLQVSDFDELDDDPFDDSGDIYSLAFTVYPMRELGIGVSYADADDLRGAPYLTSTTHIQDGASIFADWFVTENIALRAAYNNHEYDLASNDVIQDPGDVESDSVLFGVDFRF